MNSVRFLANENEEALALSRRELLRAYMGEKLDQMARHAAAEVGGIPSPPPLTNLEIFRTYVEGYLQAHPLTHKDMILMVRQLAPNPHGAPIEIYCFSNDTVRLNYEAFQSQIFDHLFAILPAFGLRAFQERSGSDLPRKRQPLAPEDGQPAPPDSGTRQP